MSNLPSTVKNSAPFKLKWGNGGIDDLVMMIGLFFDDCIIKDNVPTVLGCCLFLGITDDTWYYYVSGRYSRHTPDYIRAKFNPEDWIDDPIPPDDINAAEPFEFPKAIADATLLTKESLQNYDKRIRREIAQELKRASVKIAEIQTQLAFRFQKAGKAPIFNMFMLKAFSGYREDAPQLASSESATLEESIRLSIDESVPLQIKIEGEIAPEIAPEIHEKLPSNNSEAAPALRFSHK
jgi:hypothetical protein